MSVHGIDLGTSFSCLAAADAAGVRLIAARGANGSLLTPSVVALDAQGHAVVGEAAWAALECAEPPDSVRLFELFKRDIGIDREVSGRYEQPVLGVFWDPICLSALVLRKLALDAKASGEALTSAVIAHPHHFFVPQKNATRRAAELAGFDVALTVSEPLAAAIDQGYGRNGDAGQVMVFDFGGGTLDVNVVEASPGRLRVLGGQGDPRLGGRDFDEVVHRLFQDAMMSQHQLGYADGSAEERASWLRQARRVKEELQSRPRSRADLRIQGCHLSVNIGRQSFEEGCGALTERMADAVEGALRVSGCTWADLREVLLVGGSSRLRVVQAWLRERAGDRIRLSDRPDLAVARGAAILGWELSQGARPLDLGEELETRAPAPRFSVVNQLPRGVGVLVFDRERGERRPHPMIRGGVDLPVRSEPVSFRTTRDNAERVLVEIVEIDPESPDRWVKVGDCAMDDLPTGLPLGTRVEVSLELDLGGGLRVHAFCPLVGRAVSAKLSLGASATPTPRGCEALAATLPVIAEGL